MASINFIDACQTYRIKGLIDPLCNAIARKAEKQLAHEESLTSTQCSLIEYQDDGQVKIGSYRISGQVTQFNNNNKGGAFA